MALRSCSVRRITAVETVHADGFPNLCYVRIHTDEDLVGLGETFWGPATVAPRLLGQDPLQIERHWLRLAGRGLRTLGAEGRALSAVDIGLWDIARNAMMQEVVRAYLAGAYGGIVTELPRIEAGYAYAPAAAGPGAGLRQDFLRRPDAQVRLSRA